ncbi:glycosyltransferase, partial [Vibrio cholerae]|uniref:glycosyltransferase n=2 Tax=Vibrio cholerae TaxID=666 RepID=UPI00226D588F
TIIDNVIYKLQKKYSSVCDIKLNLIGANSSLDLKSKYNLIKWSEDVEAKEIDKINVGVMPLFDTPFENGKCGYKLIQYFACKKPVLASPIGVNSKIIDHGIDGFLCFSEDDWEDALEFLINNVDKQSAMGNLGFSKVKHVYNYRVQAEVINKSISSLKLNNVLPT